VHRASQCFHILGGFKRFVLQCHIVASSAWTKPTLTTSQQSMLMQVLIVYMSKSSRPVCPLYSYVIQCSKPSLIALWVRLCTNIGKQPEPPEQSPIPTYAQQASNTP
jgi:hypothetical protein